MMKSSSQLFKSILLTTPVFKQQFISEKIAKLFNLKLILSKDLEPKQPDVMAPMVFQELSKNSCRSWLLDGFPRTKTEAEQLWNEQKCHVVMNLRLKTNQLVDEASKERYVHPASGRTYLMEFNPPKKPGKDNLTGEELVRVNDVTTDEIKAIILEHDDKLKPIVEFYREVGVLQEIHGNSTADLINKSRICLSSLLPDTIM